MQNLPVGISDFKVLRDEGRYYVDKSAFIDSVMSVGKVFLFTRPRRFGKTLNMSMLDAYLNRIYVDDPDRFQGLQISDVRPDDPEKNTNLVIRISFQDLGDGNAESIMEELRRVASKLYVEFPELGDSDKLDEARRQQYNRVALRQSSESDLKSCLKDLTEMLYLHHRKKAVVLVDEYDMQVNNSFGTDDQEDIIKIVRSLLQSVFKDNDFLKFGVVTGVMKVTQKSIFSGLNNLVTNDIFDVQEQSKMFGFTPEEVGTICSDYGKSEKYDEARLWYDGYRFGDAEIYNPWSILNYVYKGFSPCEYWIGTSQNTIIDQMIDGMDADMFENFTTLGNGGTITAAINRFVTFEEMRTNNDALISVMTMAGYLRAVPGSSLSDCEVSIPNLEVRHVFAEKFLGHLGAAGARIRSFVRAVSSGETSEIEATLSSLLMSMDSKIMDHEHVYQAFFIALLMNLEGMYEITNEGKGGKGYYDIRMRSLKRNIPHAVIEVKRRRPSDGNATLEALAVGGIKQIKDMKYTAGLSGTVVMYGVAFDGMDVSVVSEVKM